MPGEKLEVLEGRAAGQHIDVGAELVIGRGSDESGRLADDPELSRRHARISTDAEGVLTVEDIGSTNGTFVNGEKIAGRRRLQPGDQIKVGATTLVVLDETGRRMQPTTISTSPSFDAPPASSADETLASTTAYGAYEPPADPYRTPIQQQQQPAEPDKGRSSGRLAALVAVPLLILAAAVAAVILIGGGDDGSDEVTTDDQASTAALTTTEIADAARSSTIGINTDGPVFDPETGETDVITKHATGIVLDASEGLVLTNAHVVAGSTSREVRLDSGETTNAIIEGQAPCEDLAVIRLRPVPDGLTEAKLGSSADMEIGNKVVAIGFPAAFEQDLKEREYQAKEGTITATTSVFSGGSLEPELKAVLQHDAALSGGMSGGALYNDQGEVVGLNTLSSADSSAQNANAAIAIDRINDLVDDLKAGKSTGYVGWGDFQLTPYENGDSLVIGSLDANSPADDARVELQDVIVQLDGREIHSLQDMCSILNSKASGDNLEARVIQGVRASEYAKDRTLKRFLEQQPVTERVVKLQ